MGVRDCSRSSTPWSTSPDSAAKVIARLVDRSLAIVDLDQDGATRYRLLDSVRAFAADRATEAGAGGVAADAVLGWVAGVADTVAVQVRGPGQAEHVALTAAERATIDAALEHARVHDPAAALRIAVGFGWAWVLLDDAAAAARLRVARTAASAARPDLLVTAMLLESWLEAMSGDLAQARTALDAATALAGADVRLQDLARWYGGFVQLQEGRLGPALADLERCRAAFASDGSTWQEGGSRLLAAFVQLALGDTPAARTACEDAIRLLEPLGDAWALLHAEEALGGIARAEHRFADAARHHAHAADSAAGLGFHGAAALHTANLGRAQFAGADPGAAATLRRAIAGAEQEGDLRMLAETRVTLAEVLLSSGDRATALDLLVTADRWFTGSGAGDGAALAASLLATLRAEDGDRADVRASGRRWVDPGAAHPRGRGVSEPPASSSPPKAAGALRADLEPTDVQLINAAVHAVTSLGGLTRADIHQRIITMIFDGVRPRPDGGPMPAPALTEDELSRAVRSSSARGGRPG